MSEGRGFRAGRRFWALIGLAALLGYAAWIGAPYLRSVVVRDAALTTWIDIVASPIRGFVDTNPLHAGDRVGTDGRIATIENPLEDGTPVARAEAELERAATAETILASAKSAYEQPLFGKCRSMIDTIAPRYWT